MTEKEKASPLARPSDEAIEALAGSPAAPFDATAVAVQAGQGGGQPARRWCTSMPGRSRIGSMR